MPEPEDVGEGTGKEKAEREELAGVFEKSAVAHLCVVPKTFKDLKRVLTKSSYPALLAIPFLDLRG